MILQGAPLFHILGQVFGMGPLCLTGDSLILLPKVNLDGLMEAVQRHKARSLYGVPALYRMILDHDRVDSYDLSSLRFCFTGGMSCPWRQAIDGRGVSASPSTRGMEPRRPSGVSR